MLQSLVIITLFWSAVQAAAHTAEEGKIHLSLGSLTSQTIFKNDRGEADAPIQGSLGFVVNGDVDDRGSIEVGGYYVDKAFMRESGTEVLVEKSRRIHMTLGYRRWIGSRIGLGIASFTSYAMGEPRQIYSTLATPSFQTSAHDTSDHGIEYSILYEAYQSKKHMGVIDIKYSQALSDREGEDADQLGIFIAYKQRTK